MKNLEKVALVVIVLFVLSWFPGPLFRFTIARLYGPRELLQYNTLTAVLASGAVLSRFLVRIGVGIWLFILARRENATPWIWLLFGLFTGLIAAILFFLMKVYEAVRPADIIEETQPTG